MFFVAFFVSLFIASKTSALVPAQDVQPTKTPEAIATHKAELRLTKTPPELIATKKAEARATKAPEREVTRAAAVTAKNAQMCERIQNRIETRLDHYETNKEKWTNRYQGIAKRLESLSEKMDEVGCDTTTLEADIATYKNLIETFAASFRDFHTTLQGTREYVCGESEGQYATKVRQSNTELAQVKQNAKALHTFVIGTLKPRLKTAANTCAALPAGKNHLNGTPKPTTPLPSPTVEP